ncbi:MAG TPA: amino acid ABC transporter substrate-binding protein [Stellaceae bacterium]|nr:amino acid ABC transporter substrate-binding protein [Stellaceae bacterium]
MSGPTIRIGYCLSLTGGLASNGKTARLAHQIWEADVNGKGGLLGRKVEMVCIDDQTNPKLVLDIYKRLLDEEKVDLIIGGYGDNSVAPAMPLIMERNRYIVALMALAVNASLGYANYFVMIPTGPQPAEALTEGFFSLAARQTPKPETMAILAADAPFSKSPVQGAKAHASKHGFRLVSEDRYPLSAADLVPFIRSLKPVNPDILFLCSYLNDSVALLRAIDEVGLEPKIVGGAMIGPQNGSIKLQLGSLMNGLVNYEYWLPVPKMMFPGVADMMTKYQSAAPSAGADPLGYYVAPQAYAQMQIVEQAVAGTGSLDDTKLAQFTRDASFKTVVGDVKFGTGGGWSEARVLQVQYQNIKGADLSEFKDATTQAVVWPPELASGALIYPYTEAKRNIRR